MISIYCYVLHLSHIVSTPSFIPSMMHYQALYPAPQCASFDFRMPIIINNLFDRLHATCHVDLVTRGDLPEMVLIFYWNFYADQISRSISNKCSTCYPLLYFLYDIWYITCIYNLWFVQQESVYDFYWYIMRIIFIYIYLYILRSCTETGHNVKLYGTCDNQPSASVDQLIFRHK